MLNIRDLTFEIGDRLLFDRASVHVPAGHHVGLVGRNGAGKTTLFRLITGEWPSDEGAIRVHRRARIESVAQEAPSGSESPLDHVLGGDRERLRLLREAERAREPQRIGEIHARLEEIDAYAAPARAARILAGLGFDETAQSASLDRFSGGFRMRAGLARALFSAPDLLLLDEPTNYLDLEGTLWLEGFLKRYPHTVLLISHDRDLLNKAVSHILHLTNGGLTLYSGGYDQFERQRRAEQARLRDLKAKQDAERAHMQAFVDRFRYKASKARQAQSRLKAIARMEPIATLAEDPAIRFRFPSPERLPRPMIRLDEVAVGYDPGPPVLSRLTLDIDMDDRIALLGPNGNGKSTFAKLLAGRLAPARGEFLRAPKLEVGYFAQHQLDELDEAATPYAHLAALMPDAPQHRIRARLGAFGFDAEHAGLPVGDLSGGEKARLLFALVTHDAPHLLILDEPTNHLDVDAREALARALNDYEGAVLLISHDAHLVTACADRLWVARKGTVAPFDGDLEDYRQSLAGAGAKSPAETGSERASPRRADRRRQAAAARDRLAPLRRRVEKAEARLEALAARKAEIERALGDPDLYRDRAGEISSLTAEAGRIAKEIKDAEYDWIAAQATLEDAEAEILDA